MLEYTSAQKAVSEIRSGDHIHLSAISSVPQVLVRALKERADNDKDLKDLHFHHFHTEGDAPYSSPEYAGVFFDQGFFVGPNVRANVNAGYADYLPAHLYETQFMYRSGALPCAVVNCDETWCRVKVAGKYGKKYIWCMVNKEAKVAVYFYDDGSRGRQVLRDFLGKTEIDALQSDGLNVYMYLDKELVDVDHLCCLAHARAKFKYAQEQGKDADAEYFISNIGRLYDLEEQYRLRHLTPQQIQQERQGDQTTKIIQKIRQRLDKLLADTSCMRGDLMNKALNYLNSFWNQLILYLKDGRYSIDNSLAERTLRPMTVERKNSLTFGSHDGAEVSVIYHTFIETCKMCGVSTLEYFKEFFKAIMQGRTDYENMLPMTIGIKK